MPPETQTDRPRPGRLLRSPLLLALVVTLANAAKPVVVDDAAYLAYARQIAAHPLDPYGFTIFWYSAPEPAFGVLAPPVVPYWLGLGIALFGENVLLLKLWLFPFVWVFAWAVGDLLRRFARGAEARFLPLVVLSAAVLPTVNLMLDVPALGLGLAAVAVFARAADRGSWRIAAAAGLLAGAAIQTKYTALLVPPAVVWYGLTHRRPALAILAAGVAFAAFAAWELVLVEKYGRSHFAFHAADQKPTPRPGETALGAFLRVKSGLYPPLVGYLGCLGVGVALAAGAVLGVPRKWLALIAGVWAVVLAAAAVLPNRWMVVAPGTTVTGIGWHLFGTLVLVAVGGCAVLLTLRFGRVPRVRSDRDSVFLAGWVLLELAGYFVLTPFGAARRVIGLVVVGGLLAGRAASRVERVRPGRAVPGWVVGFAAGAGFAVAAIDTLDAFPEKWCAERAAALAADRPPDATAWFAGHWGFQYYCERAGMKPVVPGQSVLAPGDVLVLPVYPDEPGFHRPHTGLDPLDPPAGVAEPVAEIVWDDPLSATTVPNFYGGINPVVGRDHPRLRVRVYRITAKWAVPAKPD